MPGPEGPAHRGRLGVVTGISAALTGGVLVKVLLVPLTLLKLIPFECCETVTGSSRPASQLNKRRPRVVKTYVERLQDMKQSSVSQPAVRTVSVHRESTTTHCWTDMELFDLLSAYLIRYVEAAPVAARIKGRAGNSWLSFPSLRSALFCCLCC